MKCNNCNDTILCAGDVRACTLCTRDRTANEVPYDMTDDALIEAVLERKPGLSVRFKPDPVDKGSESSKDAERRVRAAAQESTPKGEVAKPAKKVKRKLSKKKHG